MEKTITKKEALEYIKQNIGRCNLSSFNIGTTYVDDEKNELSTIAFLRGFLGDAWCPDVVEEWVKRIEHDKNNDVDYVIDSYMFGVIENDRERKSSDFHASFYYRG